MIALAAAIAELSETCRKGRTGLWCALQFSWKPGFIPLGVMSKRAEVIAREKQALKEQQQLAAAQMAAVNRSASASSSTSSLYGSGSATGSTSALSVCGSHGSPLMSGGSAISLMANHMTSQLASPGFPVSLPFTDSNNNSLQAAQSKTPHD